MLFSIIGDDSTDISLNHVLVVLIQTIENSRPLIYFYKAIEILTDETATGLTSALIAAVKNDGHAFETFFRQKITGFRSDGAPVMLEKKKLRSTTFGKDV